MTKILKQYLLITLFFLGGYSISSAQNLTINTIPVWAEVQVGSEGIIQIQIFNSSDDREVKEEGVYIGFSLNPNQEEIPHDNPRDGFFTGPEPDNWLDMSVSLGWPFIETSEDWDVVTNDGKTFTITNNKPLEPLAQHIVYVRYKGLAAGFQDYTVNTQWNYGPVNNVDGDDQSSSRITIVERPLPINLLTFDAVKDRGQVKVNWSTVSEQNNAGFDIERSADAQNWQIIGHVASKGMDGNSSNTLNYRFNDETPLNGMNYYRLRQTDIDGHSVLSEIKTVQFAEKTAIQIYPNPVVANATVKGLMGDETLRVYNAGGALVRSVKSGNTQADINFSNLAQGTYRVVIIDGNGQLQQTISVTKAR